MSTNKDIAKNASVISGFTLLSRMLGFIRDVVIAQFFGTYAYAQAFVVAFRIPNTLRDIVAEGAANSALVPVLTEYSVKKSKEEFWRLANCLLNALIVILSLLTILGIIFAPFIVRIIAPGFTVDAFKLQETIRLTRIIYPYILLISLAAYCMAVLNSLKYFSISAFAPCLLNISIIIFALIFGEGVMGLALGVLVGGLLQLIVQVPMLYKKGFRYEAVFDYKHPGVRQIGKLILPRVFSSCIYQLNIFVDTMLSSLSVIVGQGGVAALYFANRIFQFPLGIFGVAIAQAALPTMSRQALDENKADFKKTLSFSLIAIFLIMLPITAVIVSLSSPLVDVLFKRGRFDAYSSGITSGALLFYGFGLVGYSANKVLVSSFFSLKDTITPLKITGISLIINIALSLTLMFPMQLRGLALAASISGTCNFFIFMYALRKKIGPLEGRYLLKAFTKILVSSFFMAVACFYVYGYFQGRQEIVRLAAALICGFAIFILSIFIMRLEELFKVIRWLLKKK